MKRYTQCYTTGVTGWPVITNRSRWITVFLLVFICIVCSCNNSGFKQDGFEDFICGEGDTDRLAVDSTDLENASEIALKRVNSREKSSFIAERVTNMELEAGFFSDYNIFYAWGPLGHTQNIAIAVGPDGCTAILPGEFNGLARDAGIRLQNEEEATELLRFYLNFHDAIPGRDDIRIVERPDAIPGLGDSQKYSGVIKSLEFESLEANWNIQFATWQWVSGNLDSWSVEVSNNGEVEILEKERLATKVGDYVTIE